MADGAFLYFDSEDLRERGEYGEVVRTYLVEVLEGVQRYRAELERRLVPGTELGQESLRGHVGLCALDRTVDKLLHAKRAALVRGWSYPQDEVMDMLAAWLRGWLDELEIAPGVSVWKIFWAHA